MTQRLACRAVGDGPPLLIIHGLFGQGRNWQTVARRLAGRWRVYIVDLPNHGDSPWTGTMSLQSIAADLARILDAEGLSAATVIGHSLGGKAAMVLALSDPERVEALVVVDIAPVAYSHTWLPEIRAMQAVDLRFLERRAEVDAALADAIPNAADRAFLAQNVAATDDGFVWRINLEGIARSMAELAGFPALAGSSYPGRVLFVRGETSDYIARNHQDAIFELFPQAEFAVITGAGHRPHAEKPEAFLETVNGFLDSATA